MNGTKKEWRVELRHATTQKLAGTTLCKSEFEANRIARDWNRFDTDQTWNQVNAYVESN